MWDRSFSFSVSEIIGFDGTACPDLSLGRSVPVLRQVLAESCPSSADGELVILGDNLG